ncbi:MAG: ABC transporter permease [Bauldia sp.]|nr:ABC transporter permease [Bauldia sp.]
MIDPTAALPRAGARQAPVFLRALRASRAVIGREIGRTVARPGRVLAVVLFPLLWLVVFAPGVQSLSGGVSVAPYDGAYKPLQEYMIPGLVALVLLLNGVRSALAFVHERDAEQVRTLMTAPLPRWVLIGARLVAVAVVSLAEAYLCLAAMAVLGNFIVGVDIPWAGWAVAIPFVFLAGWMLAAASLALAVFVRALTDRAGTVLFLVVPVFLLSSALYPAWRFRDNDAAYLQAIATLNPFTHAVELIRYAAYGSFTAMSLAVVLGVGAVAVLLAVVGFDPERRTARATS